MRKIFTLLVLLVLAVGVAIPTAIPVMAGDPSPTTIDLPVTYRDFHGMGWDGSDGYSAHPDFEDGIYGLETGIVKAALGVDAKPVYVGGASTHGQTAFDQWYRDTANVNQALAGILTLTRDGSGNYVYTNYNFFPLDGLLLGNEGRGHNYHFTMELHSTFTYEAGQTFSFTGDDDLWVFINHQLAVDLGGVHPAVSGSVNLDTLGLNAGETYDFDLFFAERHTTESNVVITTNIPLLPPPPPVPEMPTVLLLGVGLVALGGFVWYRKHRAVVA